MSLIKKHILEPQLERENYEHRFDEVVDFEYSEAFRTIGYRETEAELPNRKSVSVSEGNNKTNGK